MGKTMAFDHQVQTLYEKMIFSHRCQNPSQKKSNAFDTQVKTHFMKTLTLTHRCITLLASNDFEPQVYNPYGENNGL